MRRWARLAAAGESAVYFYYFTHTPPIRYREYYGAHHGADKPERKDPPVAPKRVAAGWPH